MSKKDPKSPATTTAQFDTMAPAWEKIQTVLDGTDALRAAGQAYLPQHDKESDSAYRERLERATLFNMAKMTLDAWVGRPFSEPVELKDDVPAEIVELTENIDTLGSNMQVFARNWFREGMAKAFSHVLVDMPRLDERPDGRPRTLEDDRIQGVRPYWVHVKPEQLFFADAEVIGGEEFLTEIRFVEYTKKRDGFAIVDVPQIKRMILGDGQVEVEVYEEVRTKTKKKAWQVVDRYTMEIDRIPLVTFYADRADLMLGTPPLADLVDLNIAHWQSTSDQRAILTVARFPLLACSGGTDETNQLVVGPNQWLYTPDAAGRFYYVEHSGKAIQSGLDDLSELARQMGEYGSEWLKKRPNRETATARTLDSAEATSALQDATLRFQDALENALSLTAYWLNLPGGGSVEVHNSYSEGPTNTEDLRILVEARKNKDISREAFINELKRAGLLDETFDAAEDGAILEQEIMDSMPLPLAENAAPGEQPAMNDDDDEDADDAGE
jgi:hypothetical protein